MRRIVRPVLVISLFLFIQGVSSPIPLPDSLTAKTDSLFACTADTLQRTFVEVLKDSHTVYYAATFKTLHVPYELARARFRQVNHSFGSFSHIKKFQKIETPLPFSPHGTYLVVVGVLFARSWFLGDIDSLRSDSAASFKLVINRNHDDSLNRKFRRQEDGLFVVEYRDFSIEWRMKDLGNGKTRAALVAAVASKIWIPGWLYKIVSKVVFPGVLESFERSLKKKA